MLAQNQFIPSSIRLGADLSRTMITLIDPDRTQAEFNADMDLHKFFLSVDYGWARTNIPDSNYNYSMDGSFYRIGADYNFLAYDPDYNVIFFGIRYGHSSFSEEFFYSRQNQYFGPYTRESAKSDNSAGWYEAVAGIKVRIWKELYLGWTGRLKFGLNVNAPGSLITYEIPGYGLADKTSRYGMNYSLYYKIVFRKKPIPTPKKKKPDKN